MIHRAPMTKKEMTEEDFKYRQGRSKKQTENNNKILVIFTNFSSSTFNLDNIKNVTIK